MSKDGFSLALVMLADPSSPFQPRVWIWDSIFSLPVNGEWWGTSFACWKPLFLQGLKGWLPCDDITCMREYVKTADFAARILLSFLAASAMLLASLFVVIPAWRNSFYHSVWVFWTLVILWPTMPNMEKTWFRLLGAVLGGMCVYSLINIFKGESFEQFFV